MDLVWALCGPMEAMCGPMGAMGDRGAMLPKYFPREVTGTSRFIVVLASFQMIE